jgi:hypothetical protein
MKSREFDLLIVQVEKEPELNTRNSKASELLEKLYKFSSIYPPNLVFQFEKRLLHCTFANKENEIPQILKAQDESSISKPLFTPIIFQVNENVYENLKNQSIEIDNIDSLSIYNCHGCTFKVKNIKCSTFIKNCSDCEFTLSTNQLRISECKSCTFIIYTLTGPVIEESNQLLFSCLIESPENKWKQVRDFDSKPNSFKFESK